MAPFQYYLHVLKNYAQFDGRARRSEFWYYALFSLIISIILEIISPTLDRVYAVATLVPSIAVGIRRMHDVNKSGWFILIPIYNIILYCTPGDAGSNEYGADPKEVL
ncbi:MAG: DUF805 domain-containing protein [Bacteroidetes bacterium]|nr:DUF805 domain-containing protein [Bacteroidota bacterium]